MESHERNSGKGESANGDSCELDIVVAGGVVMMAEKKKDAEQRTWIHLKENDISVKVDDETFSRRPSRTKFFFNPKMMTNREMALLALLALVKEKEGQVEQTTDVPHAPIEALDAFAASGIGGMRWKRILASRAKVYFCENDEETFQRLLENCEDNGFRVRTSSSTGADSTETHADATSSSSDLPSIVAFNEDCNVVMLRRGFDFIHLDPFGSTVHHLDAAFKNVRHGGVVILTSTDTGSLFGKVPTVAKRNYDAFVTKTEYFRELAARMVLAAAARAAAKCNKGFQVLYVVAMEHFVQTAVRICRGAQPADKTVEKVAKVVHCLVCEERSVVPNSNHPLDAAECLVCDCVASPSAMDPPSLHQQQYQHHHHQRQSRGRNRILLGPVWCGPIYDAQFVEKMENIAGPNDEPVGRKRKDAGRNGAAACRNDGAVRKNDPAVDNSKPEKIPFSAKTREVLHLIKAEALCAASSIDGTSQSETENAAQITDGETSSKRRRISEAGSGVAPVVGDAGVNGRVSPNNLSLSSSSEGLRRLSAGEPLFYYNTHLHVPKGLELLKVERVIELLRKDGHRASRTHFDTVSVRTTATASQLKKLAQLHCQPIRAAK